MENEASSTPQQKPNMLPIALVAATVVIIIVGVIVFAMNGNNNDSQQATTQPSPTHSTEQHDQAQLADDVLGEEAYANGEYTQEGVYTSPGGEESIEVTLTLAEGVVEKAEVTSNATRPISKQMQAAFIGGFEEQVIGKKIDEINVTKVAASSLTPMGFNDALEKIKSQALAAS